MSVTLSDAAVTLEIGAVASKVDAVGLEIEASPARINAVELEIDAADQETDACRVEIEIACAETVGGSSSGATGGVKSMSVPSSAVSITVSRRAVGLFSKSARCPSGLPQRGNVNQPSGCEGRATLGNRIKSIIYPNRVVAIRRTVDDATPWEISAKVTTCCSGGL